MARRNRNSSSNHPARRWSVQQIVFVLLSVLIVASFVLSMIANY
jgi:hypothetical protein